MGPRFLFLSFVFFFFFYSCFFIFMKRVHTIGAPNQHSQNCFEALIYQWWSILKTFGLNIRGTLKKSNKCDGGIGWEISNGCCVVEDSTLPYCMDGSLFWYALFIYAFIFSRKSLPAPIFILQRSTMAKRYNLYLRYQRHPRHCHSYVQVEHLAAGHRYNHGFFVLSYSFP